MKSSTIGIATLIGGASVLLIVHELMKRMMEIDGMASCALALLPIAPIFPFVSRRAQEASRRLRATLESLGIRVVREYGATIDAASRRVDLIPVEELKLYKKYQLINIFLSGYSFAWGVSVIATFYASII